MDISSLQSGSMHENGHGNVFRDGTDQTVRERAMGYLNALNVNVVQINTPNASGQVPLEEAIRDMKSEHSQVDIEVVRGLIALGANPAALSSEDGKSLADLAAELGDVSGNTDLQQVSVFLMAMTQLQGPQFSSSVSLDLQTDVVLRYLEKMQELGATSTELLIGGDKDIAADLSAEINAMVMSDDNASDGASSMRLTALLERELSTSNPLFRAVIRSVAQGASSKWLPNAGQSTNGDNTV